MRPTRYPAALAVMNKAAEAQGGSITTSELTVKAQIRSSEANKAICCNPSRCVRFTRGAGAHGEYVRYRRDRPKVDTEAKGGVDRPGTMVPASADQNSQSESTVYPPQSERRS
jgi:hypothetical protein